MQHVVQVELVKEKTTIKRRIKSIYRKNTLFIFLAVFICFVLSWVSSLYSQEKSGDEFTLEEITVTAEKREENIQKTSLSLSVLTGDQIQEKAYSAITDMLQNVPGLQIQGAGTSSQIFIRGIGLNNLDTAYGDPAIALNVDGIQQQRGGAVGQSTMDVERVEVLRGPQGTMYGRNATGGAVNIIMVQPKDKFETSARAQLGNYNLRTYEAMVNVPVYSKLALRLSGVKDYRDTYMASAEGFQDQLTGRIKALFKPNDDLSLTGTVEYRKDKSRGGWGSVPYSVLKTSDDPWSYSGSTGGPGGPGGGSNNWSESWNYSLNLAWNIMDWTTMTFIPAMSTNETHFKMTSGSFEPPPPYPKGSQYTYELRFANGTDSKMTWTLGGFLWDSSNQNAEQELSTRAGWNLQQGDRPTGSWAAFGQATYPVTDRFRFIGGLRYSFDNKKQEYRIYYNNAEGVKTYDSGIVSYGDTLTKPTWKVGMEYDLASDSMAYLQAAQGYKSGGVTFDYNMIQGDPTGTNYNIVDLASHRFDEETSIAYELGSKNRFMSNRLQVNGSLFLTAYKGLQVMMWKRLNEEDEDSDPVMFIGNGGKTNTWGAEVETTWLATYNDRVNLSMSSMRGKYHDLIIKYDNPAWAGGGSNPPVDLEGKSMANMPRLSVTLGYTHSFMFDNYGTLAATVDSTYKTEYYNTIEITNQGALVPNHRISNFYLNWSSPNGMFSASANIKNIENKAIATNASQRGVGLNAPRTYSASLTVKY